MNNFKRKKKDDQTSFTKNEFNSIIKELENTMEQSQLLASQANQINTLQTKKLGLFNYSINNK